MDPYRFEHLCITTFRYVVRVCIYAYVRRFGGTDQRSWGSWESEMMMMVTVVVVVVVYASTFFKCVCLFFCVYSFSFFPRNTRRRASKAVVERGKMSSNVFFFIDLAFVNGYSWLYTTEKKRRSQMSRTNFAMSVVSNSLCQSPLYLYIHVFGGERERERKQQRYHSSFCFA